MHSGLLPFEIDPVVANHNEECKVMRQVRNDAAVFYATKAIGMANMEGDSLVGNRVQVFRNDVNYPYTEIQLLIKCANAVSFKRSG